MKRKNDNKSDDRECKKRKLDKKKVEIEVIKDINLETLLNIRVN